MTTAIELEMHGPRFGLADNNQLVVQNTTTGAQYAVTPVPDADAAYNVSDLNRLVASGTYTQVVSLTDVLINSVGTWTRTRIAEGNFVLRHTAADDTSVVSFDITQAVNAATGKGMTLTSIDVVSSIGTLALDAHTATLDKITYANNAAVTVTSVPLTGTLPTATQENPYVSNLAVTTPAVNNTAASKYVFELTVNAAATSAYDLYGLVLHFGRTN